MSDRLRWILILGCAVVAVLHAPTAASLIVESWSGPYATPPARAGSTAFAPGVPHAAETALAPHDGEVGDAQAADGVASLRGELAQRF